MQGKGRVKPEKVRAKIQDRTGMDWLELGGVREKWNKENRKWCEAQINKGRYLLIKVTLPIDIEHAAAIVGRATSRALKPPTP